MTSFATKVLAAIVDEVAPDGSDVRVLLGVTGGLMAHYELAPGQVTTAVTNRTVEEIWFFISGHGLMWRKQGTKEEIVPVESGVCVTIPLGTHFQLRSLSYEPLVAIGVTIPPWPGKEEAIMVEAQWEPTVP